MYQSFYAESFATGKWFNCSFRKKLVVFRGRRRCWTENQFVRHERLKVVRATLSATITLFTPPTTQWYFCNILPYLRPFNFWFLPAVTLAFPCKISRPPNFCLLACLNFKLVFLYFVPLDICVSRFLSPRTLPTEGYRKSKLRSIFHIHLYFTGVKLGIKICCCSHGSSDRGVSYQVSGLLRVLISRLCDY